MGWAVGQLVGCPGRSRSVGGDGAAAPLAEVGDAVHALVHGRVHGEGGPDAVPARRVAPDGRRVHAPALRRVRLGAPAAAVAARPRAPPRLRRRRSRRLLFLSSVPSALDAGVMAMAVVVVVAAAGFGERRKSCEDDGEDAKDHQQRQRRASPSSHLCLSLLLCLFDFFPLLQELAGVEDLLCLLGLSGYGLYRSEERRVGKECSW